MNSLVAYCSHKGNTRQVAERIADTLGKHGHVQVLGADEVPAALPADVDLLVIGGPTEGHGMTPEIVALLERLGPQQLRGRRTAAFDTRIKWPRILSGSAGDRIAAHLRAAGAEIMGPVGSFLVTTKPELEPGELDRAAAWASDLAARLDAKVAVASPA